MRPSLRVAAGLRERLAAGEWATGRALPSIAQLATEYQTSRTTITRALHMLADEGRVEIIPRWGTFVPDDEDAAPLEPV